MKRKKQNHLFANDMFLYIENPEDYTKKNLLKLINEFSKVEGYKINTEKIGCVFIY